MVMFFFQFVDVDVDVDIDVDVDTDTDTWWLLVLYFHNHSISKGSPAFPNRMGSSSISLPARECTQGKVCQKKRPLG